MSFAGLHSDVAGPSPVIMPPVFGSRHSGSAGADAVLSTSSSVSFSGNSGG